MFNHIKRFYADKMNQLIIPNDPQLKAIHIFTDDDTSRNIYASVFASIEANLTALPGNDPTHVLLAERCAYYYAKSIQAAANPEVPIHVEQAYNNQFNRAILELGREKRTLQRDNSFKQNLVRAIISILKNELKNAPDLLDRVIQRLKEL